VLLIARIVTSAIGMLASDASTAASHELTAGKAVILGLVEGITEYLPVSSTGHLLVTQKLLGVGDTDATKDAADTYAITIQAGAILAVVLLYFGRLRAMAEGVIGRDRDGRHVLIALLIAFVPAAVVGVALEQPIKDHLFGVGPVIVAWIVGGVAILVASRWLRERPPGRIALEQISVRMAIIIGAAQVLALWPGTSRSLVTILAALFLGMSMPAALEFSFLLGLATLSAATLFEALKHGGELVDTYGLLNPLIGFVVAFVAAVVAVRWLVSYLGRHGLELFGWYRIVVAAIAIILVATGTI
jgi:undecaprenyl-diphosphatase